MKILGVGELAIHYIRANIITQTLKPGQKLNELELSKELGISRSPLREAFRVLEGDGLIIQTPRKGCYVSEMSPQDCKNIFETREMIECFSIDILKEKKIVQTPSLRAALENSIASKLNNSSDCYARYKYIKAIADFHFRLVEASGNNRIYNIYERLFPCLARYQALYTFPDVMKGSHEEHKEILNMIEKSEYENAKTLLSKHIKHFINVVDEIMPDKK